MTREEVINILQNIDPQCQNDCPVSREYCAKQENKCLVSEALKYAVDFLSANVTEVKHGHWELDGTCSACRKHTLQSYGNFCCYCGADMREWGETNE